MLFWNIYIYMYVCIMVNICPFFLCLSALPTCRVFFLFSQPFQNLKLVKYFSNYFVKIRSLCFLHLHCFQLLEPSQTKPNKIFSFSKSLSKKDGIEYSKCLGLDGPFNLNSKQAFEWRDIFLSFIRIFRYLQHHQVSLPTSMFIFQ